MSPRRRSPVRTSGAGLGPCIRCGTRSDATTAYTLIATTAPPLKHLFCGLNCLTEWVTDEKFVELLNSARAEQATTAYESFMQLLVAAGAIDRQEPETVGSLLDDLDGELGLHHTPMHHCTQCGQPRPVPESFIVLSPGMLKGRGVRRRRVLCSLTCLSASLRSDIERDSR